MTRPEGMITVAEAARRLGRSIEQVRRYLREGKLPGQRIGQQWFIPAEALPLVYHPAGALRRVREPAAVMEAPRMTREAAKMTKEEIAALFRRIDERREAIRRRLGRDIEPDIVEILHEEREAH